MADFRALTSFRAMAGFGTAEQDRDLSVCRDAPKPQLPEFASASRHHAHEMIRIRPELQITRYCLPTSTR